MDVAHEAWIKCVVAQAQVFAARGDNKAAVVDAAYEACPREEHAVRSVLVRLHPGSGTEAINDIIHQFRTRTIHLVRAAVANAVRH